MSMSVVIIGPDEQAAIDALVAHARANCIPWEVLAPHAVEPDKQVLTLEDRTRPEGPPRPEPRHIMLGNVLAAFSYEEQPAGICRHLSVSVERKGMLPSPEAVGMVAEAFGFTTFPPVEGEIWIEEFEPGHSAINVIEVAEKNGYRQ